jgi:hypothetical protein
MKGAGTARQLDETDNLLRTFADPQLADLFGSDLHFLAAPNY